MPKRRWASACKGSSADGCSLACKTKGPRRPRAREELDRSHGAIEDRPFDLYQMHCLRSFRRRAAVVRPRQGACGGDAQGPGSGEVRSGSPPTTKADLAAMKQHRFDAVMFPINFVELMDARIGKPLLELAASRGLPWRRSSP